MIIRPLARIVGLIILTAGAWAGCKETTSAPTRYLIFLDQSGSVSQTQRDQWVDVLSTEVLPAIRPGDEILIFPLHGRTGAAGPLFRARTPTLRAAETYSGLRASRTQMIEVRRSACQAIQQALSLSQPAQRTDILGIFDRCQQDDSAQTVLIIISDMLNATPELNLERVHLTDGKMSDIIARIANAHYWSGSTLQGVRVFCLLNSVSTDADAAPNSRVVLGRFWRTLVSSLGGELSGFDTHFNGSIAMGREG